jgi:hypothetical protein
MCYEELDEFEGGYADAVIAWNGFWPEDDTEEYAKWEAAGVTDFSLEAISKIRADCAQFRSILPVNEDGEGLLNLALEFGYTERDAGWDFWMSRQRSGADFSDRGLEEVGEALAVAADIIGETHVEIGEDGFIYFA